MDKNYGSPGPAIEEHSFAPTMPTSKTHFIQLFGSISVYRNGVGFGATQLGGTKPRQILTILAMNLGTPVSKHQLIELLWGEHPPAKALATLESHVSVLRRNLQPGFGKAGPLQTATGGYLLDRRVVEVDHDRFDSLLSRAHSAGPAATFALLSEALALAGAPLLNDEFALSWAADERARLTVIVTATQVLAAEAAATLGLAESSIELARAALANDPLNERAWTALILGLEQVGRPTEGLQRYERCRRLLHQELGCSPGQTLRDAHKRLLRATGDAHEELSEVISALLILHDRLNRSADAPSTVSESLSQAGGVVSAFLRRALAAV